MTVHATLHLYLIHLPSKYHNPTHVVVVVEVVDPVDVNDKQSGVPETIGLVITNRLKARIFWSQLIGRKFNSLRGEAAGEVVHVVVVKEVVGLVRVDKEQSESPETIRLVITKKTTQTFWFWLCLRALCLVRTYRLKARTWS